MQEDPITLHIVPPTGATTAVAFSGAGSSSYSFVRTGIGPLSATYRYTVSSSHYIDLFIGRQVGKRSRYTVRLTETELVADPMNSELNVQKTSTVYVVGDIGVLGTGTNWDKMLHGLAEFLYDSTDEAPWFNSVVGGQN